MKRRVNLAILMGLIAVLALGLAAMTTANPDSYRFIRVSILLIYLVATVGAVVRKNRGAWVGFAIFGWAYHYAYHSSAVAVEIVGPLPDYRPIEHLVDWMYPKQPIPKKPFDCEVAHDERGYFKYLDGQLEIFSPTTEEARAIDDYLTKFPIWQRGFDARNSAYSIAIMFLGLSFALCGAFAGHALDDRSKHTVTSPDSNPAA
jgi:hypothetical protein